jgi:hypothetical protein
MSCELFGMAMQKLADELNNILFVYYKFSTELSYQKC